MNILENLVNIVPVKITFQMYAKCNEMENNLKLQNNSQSKNTKKTMIQKSQKHIRQ